MGSLLVNYVREISKKVLKGSQFRIISLGFFLFVQKKIKKLTNIW